MVGRSPRRSIAAAGLPLAGWLLGGSIALGACGGGETQVSPAAPAPPGAPWFEEIHERAGIDFLHASDAGTNARRFPEIMGGGVALLDLEGDGDLDLYFVQSGVLASSGLSQGPGNELYANDGSARFRNVSAGSGADDRGYGMGVAAGDFDQDGRTDLYVTNLGPNALLANRGGGRFEDVSFRAGVAAPTWSTSAAFLDPDADGDLDLWVCNYVAWVAGQEPACTTPAGRPDYCSPNSFHAPLSDLLLANAGDGTFVDVSAEAGLLARSGNGLGVVAGDFDGDGWLDVFVANDQMENHLWRGKGGLRFQEVALRAGCAVDTNGATKAGMGALAEDVDDDGDLDLLVVNLRAQADSFYRNQGGWFEDDTARIGLGSASRPFTRFGVGWIDFDDDGRLDLYQANGRVVIASEVESRSADPYAEPNLLFAGGPDGRFRAVSPEGGVTPALVHTSRGAAFGDLDGDGGVDVVVVNRDAAPYVLRNVAPLRGHWIRFRVLEEHGRDALGAVLTVALDPEGKGRTLRRDVRSAYGYCAASDPRVHVGLGELTAVARVDVRWPGGEVERFGPFEADREVTLTRGTGSR